MEDMSDVIDKIDEKIENLDTGYQEHHYLDLIELLNKLFRSGNIDIINSNLGSFEEFLDLSKKIIFQKNDSFLTLIETKGVIIEFQELNVLLTDIQRNYDLDLDLMRMSLELCTIFSSIIQIQHDLIEYWISSLMETGSLIHSRRITIFGEGRQYTYLSVIRDSFELVNVTKFSKNNQILMVKLFNLAIDDILFLTKYDSQSTNIEVISQLLLKLFSIIFRNENYDLEGVQDKLASILPILSIIDLKAGYLLFILLLEFFESGSTHHEHTLELLNQKSSEPSLYRIDLINLASFYQNRASENIEFSEKIRVKTIKNSLAKCSNCMEYISVNFRICPECNSELENCDICKLSFNEGSKIMACPHCDNQFHPSHFREWIKVKGSCPICKEMVSKLDI